MVNLRFSLPLSLDRRKAKKDGKSSALLHATRQRPQSQPVTPAPISPFVTTFSHTAPSSPRRRYRTQTAPAVMPLRVTLGPTVLRSNLTPRRQVTGNKAGRDPGGSKPSSGRKDEGRSKSDLVIPILPYRSTEKSASPSSPSRSGTRPKTSFKPRPNPLDLPKIHSLRISIPTAPLSSRSYRSSRSSPRTPGTAFSPTYIRSLLSARFDPGRSISARLGEVSKKASPTRTRSYDCATKPRTPTASIRITAPMKGDKAGLDRHRPQPLNLQSSNTKQPKCPVLSARSTCATPLGVPPTPLSAVYAASPPGRDVTRAAGGTRTRQVAGVGECAEVDDELEWEIIGRIGGLSFVEAESAP